MKSIRNLKIKSGVFDRDTHGQWCGMPFPSKSQKEAYAYWEKCVTPKAGFINVLQCESINGTIGGVLGYVSIERGVCYAAHMHWADEAYWQVTGSGSWRTWDWLRNHSRWSLKTEVDLRGAPSALHVNAREHPHELDTTDSTSMVLLYWWGKKPDTHPDDYTWVSQIRDTWPPLEGRSCGNLYRIPANVSSGLGPIFQKPHC